MEESRGLVETLRAKVGPGDVAKEIIARAALLLRLGKVRKRLVSASLTCGEHAEKERGIRGEPWIGGDLLREGSALLQLPFGKQARCQQQNRRHVAGRGGDHAPQCRNRLVEIAGLEVGKGAVQVLAGGSGGELRLLGGARFAVAEGDELRRRVRAVARGGRA